MGAILSFIHAWLDYGLSCVKMIQNREVGWLTVDRKTGKFMREKQPIWKKIKLLILFNPVMEWVDRTKVVRFWMHEKAVMMGMMESSPRSKAQIKSFVDFFKIDMKQFDPEDLDEYKTFQDFFIRRHKQGTRPIYKEGDPNHAVTVADSRLVVYPTLPEAQKIWIKGHHFSLRSLMIPKGGAPPPGSGDWKDAAIASFRLSPQDYHRYHCPVEGTVSWFREIPGDYYGVDPLCIRSGVDVLTRNARSVVILDSEQFGKVLFVAIGAKEVGTVRINKKFRNPGARVGKGEELGYFEYGGSSVVVAFERGRIVFDEDLVRHSRNAVEVDVEVGMSLGRARSKEEAEREE